MKSYPILEYFLDEDKKTQLGVSVDHSKLDRTKNILRLQIGMFFIELHPDRIEIEDDMNRSSNGECATESFLYGYMYDEELTLDEVGFMEYSEKTAIYSLIIGYLNDQR